MMHLREENIEHRFRQYSVEELDACGRAFVSAFACPRCEKTKNTTEAVKQFFARTAGSGITVLGCNGWGELMLDQCHVTYPAKVQRQTRINFWDSILKQPVIMRLALESE